jgi:transposase
MIGRGELSDTAWATIAPLLPPDGRRGRPWADHRKIINGILWKVRTGAPWRDLPERYGPWQTCFDRFVRWRRNGTWERLLSRVRAKSDAISDVLIEVVEEAFSEGQLTRAGCSDTASLRDRSP